MKKISITILILCSLILCTTIQSQTVIEEWVTRYNGPENSGENPKAIAVDGSGNIYVTGSSYGLGSIHEYTTIKYNSNGVQQWVARYHRGIATAIAIDDSGNVYVTGVSVSDFVTIKYNADGVQQWARRYISNAGGASAIAIDDSGNVYVIGSNYGGPGSNDNYATVKYSTEGVQLWVTIYISPGWDLGRDITVDDFGNVYVTGFSNYDYATVKYNSNGLQQWVARYIGPGNSGDGANAIAIDEVGNIYVTGSTYVGSGTGSDYATIKYNTEGVQQWAARYAGPTNLNDKAVSLAIDGLGNSYVTGYSPGIGTDRDYATIKYNTEGVQQWVTRYNGPGNSMDMAYSIATDVAGNSYVTGYSSSWNGITGQDYTTIKYNSNGIQQFVARYNGPVNSSDYAFDIALDRLGNVYVTGQSFGKGTGQDYTTIKYSIITKIQNISSKIPEQFSLSQNYPNPFNPTTKINFDIPSNARRETRDVRLIIFNIVGKEMATLVNEEINAGSFSVDFNGENFPSGIYYYKLVTDNYSEVKKMILLK